MYEDLENNLEVEDGEEFQNELEDEDELQFEEDQQDEDIIIATKKLISTDEKKEAAQWKQSISNNVGDDEMSGSRIHLMDGTNENNLPTPSIDEYEEYIDGNLDNDDILPSDEDEGMS